ncbi:MAG: hypothetical protein JWM21_3740 [Acidobacteria bacterium]|nr:hypothetical protein [Acidobacteriota bacterium]
MPAPAKRYEHDLSKFPAASVSEYSTLVCLACTFDIFTSQLGLAPRTAYSEIKRYAPTVQELTAPAAARPFFDSEEKHPHCPYCDAVKRWHARLETLRLEGSKATDAARRALLKSLPGKDDQFQVIETKSDRRAVFFEWLDTLRAKVDFDDPAWLVAATRAFLERRDAKTDWDQVFAGVRGVRRSSRLKENYEREDSRLFLAPSLFNDVLLVQYLLSRSHQSGGSTLAGRLTLLELTRRFRRGDYLNTHGITESDQFEILEQLVADIAGAGSVKLYYIVDRRDFLEKVKSVYAQYAA